MSGAATGSYLDLYHEAAPDLDPRHLEAYMRLQYGTLDNIHRDRFLRELQECAAAVRLDPAEAEDLARSMGL
jgi:hypothetical protein